MDVDLFPRARFVVGYAAPGSGETDGYFSRDLPLGDEIAFVTDEDEGDALEMMRMKWAKWAKRAKRRRGEEAKLTKVQVERSPRREGERVGGRRERRQGQRVRKGRRKRAAYPASLNLLDAVDLFPNLVRGGEV